MQKGWIILLGVVLMSACAAPEVPRVAPVLTAQATPTVPAANGNTVTPVNPGGVTLDLLKNFTYSLNSLAGVPVPLQNGKAQLKNPDQHLTALAMLIEPVALGDLNGDGKITLDYLGHGLKDPFCSRCWIKRSSHPNNYLYQEKLWNLVERCLSNSL